MNLDMLQFTWWIIVGAMMCIYAATAGFDLGVTMIMPWLKDETDRRIVLNTSAPVWDGNNTWIIFIGGLFLVIFPPLYSTAFSGLLAAMYCILWCFFLRPVGYDYRGKINSHRWRRTWDVALFISAVVPVFVFGVASANAFEGFGFTIDPISLRSVMTESFWGLFSWAGIFGGVASIILILSHGGAYMARRTEGTLRLLGRKIHLICTLLLFLFFAITALFLIFHKGFDYRPHVLEPPNGKIIVEYVNHGWWTNMLYHPWKFIGPALTVIFMLITLYFNRIQRFTLAFWTNVGVVFGTVATTGLILFPFIFPSYESPQISYTIWNATPTRYTLAALLYFAVVVFIIVAIYKFFTYYQLWNKQKTITAEDVKANEHHFY